MRDIFDYEPETGVLRWKYRSDCTKHWNSRLAGKPAGSVQYRKGRALGIRTAVLGKSRYVHCLIWAWVHGTPPSGFVDHINGDPLDNRIENLRLATVGGNRANSRSKGAKGVRERTPGRFEARIRHSGKTHHLGVFPTEAEASAAYSEAAKKAFGDFACWWRR